jgi:hypothetical protein
MRLLALPSAAFGAARPPDDLRLVFGLEKGETVAADGPFLASSSRALMAHIP